MPRDLTPLDRTPEQLDTAAEVDAEDIEAAEVWGRANLPAPYGSALTAELYEPPDPDPPR